MADVAGELEAAVTDAGTLLVWAEKYRHPDPEILRALRRRLLGAGDDARRLARTGILEGPAAASLLAEVKQTARQLRAMVTAMRASPIYREAVAACRAGDLPALAARLPVVFSDLEVAPTPDAALWVPVWQRRGRPLPAAAVAEAILGLRTAGVPGLDDDLSPAVDPELPGVVLSLSGVLGAPLALRYDAGVLPTPSLRLGDDQLLVPGPVLRLPFTVTLTETDETTDEWVADPEAYRRDLEAACRRLGVPLSEKLAPATSS